MKVHAFLQPAAQVVACNPDDTLRQAMAAMTEKKVGAIVVLDYCEAEHIGTKALGLLTKSDFVDAYQKELSLETPVKDIMSQVLACLNENTNKDDAAKFFEAEHKHHALVINNDGDFVGLISSLEIR